LREGQSASEKLASELGWQFRDADSFHPPANIAKMAAGIPLDDADRAPWLASIRAYIDATLAAGERAVVTCSALRQAYRDALLADPKRVRLVHLSADAATLHPRLEHRAGHFMGPGMLSSQLATLEPPGDDVLTLDARHSPAALVAEIRLNLSL
jgi:carbohydrate kinase (thermoresistant glucokinase family)